MSAQILPASSPDDDTPEPARVLRFVLRIAVAMLGSGASTDDVETSMVSLARAFGVQPVQAAVTFSMVSVSHDRADGPPITVLHFVKDRSVDFDRLASLAQVVARVRRGELDLEAAEAAVADVEAGRPPYGTLVRLVAPAASAAGSTIIFGGNALDALATFGVAIAIQPALSALDRSSLPPFFRVAFGAAASATLVALLVVLGAGIDGGLVLTGSLLRFLPGYALVAGLRDLISQSIMSGTARLAEALLLGAGVAGGLALAIRFAAVFDVQLAIKVEGTASWNLAAVVVAALLAVGGFASQLGVPRREVGFAAVLGAAAWILYDLALQGPSGDTPAATLLAAALIGVIGRILARWRHGPSLLYVVPAILPLLPGLLLVQAMLAVTDVARLGGLVDAIVAAFLVGVGVATGDILVETIVRIRERILAPAFGAVAGGVEVLVEGPVARVLGGMGRPGSEPDPGPEPRPREDG